MTTTDTKVLLTTHLGVAIYVDAQGEFSATPAGCRKERTGNSLYDVKDQIATIQDKKVQSNRKDANLPVRVFTGGKVKRIKYVGVLGASQGILEPGHLLQHYGEETRNIARPREIYVVPDRVTAEEIHKLEEALELAVAAATVASKLQEEYTVKVRLGFTAYNLNAASLMNDQIAAVESLKKAAESS